MKPQCLAQDLIFPESLTWHDKAVWYVDMYAGELFRQRHGAEPQRLLSHSGFLGGMDWNAADELCVVSKLKHYILREDGEVAAEIGSATSPLNDMIIASDGTIFVGEYGFDLMRGAAYAPGRLWAIKTDGSVLCAVQKLAFPNGMGWAQDGETLYVVETLAGRVSAYTHHGEGQLEPAGVVINAPDTQPDGMCVDPDGSIWIACRGDASVRNYTADGGMIRRIKTGSLPADICLTDDGSTLIAGISDAKPDDLAKRPIPRTGKIVAYDLKEIACD